MKALGIVAGPRKGKTTDMLVDSALRGLSERGATVEKVYLYDLLIKPCTSCLRCQETGRCVIDDDFTALSLKVRQSDVLVFASPTYFSNVTSQSKAFIDRGYSYFIETSFGLKYRFDNPKKALLLTSCDAPFPFSHLLGLSTGCIRAMKIFFRYMRAKIVTLTVTGAKNSSDERLARMMRRAYEVGRKM